MEKSQEDHHAQGGLVVGLLASIGSWIAGGGGTPYTASTVEVHFLGKIKNQTKKKQKRYTAFGLPSWSPTLVLTELDPA
jgi:hypothetical protein